MESDKRLVEFKLLVDRPEDRDEIERLRRYVKRNLSICVSESSDPDEFFDEIITTDEVDASGSLVSITGKISVPRTPAEASRGAPVVASL